MTPPPARNRDEGESYSSTGDPQGRERGRSYSRQTPTGPQKGGRGETGRIEKGPAKERVNTTKEKDGEVSVKGDGS